MIHDTDIPYHTLISPVTCRGVKGAFHDGDEMGWDNYVDLTACFPTASPRTSTGTRTSKDG